ncbi:MAG TPA: IlvD/Edd family dehydratase [Caulobacteraceae bacterium]|nr:IlvD/Edd family dehydratase [Caulobacteraceae bacterium]
MRRTLSDLRSQRWFGRGAAAFAFRSRTLQNGLASEDFGGKPVIGVLNTWSEMNTCHGHLREVAEAVKRGVWEAGGYPVELPAISLGEIMMRPTTMLYRNLLAMETEELLRSNPIDGAVLLGGCDKTTPGLLMGAISMDLPAIYVPAGFMLHGLWRGERLGSGIDAWKYGAELRAGRISRQQWGEIEAGSARTVGTCNVMGTASTMTAIAEALGMTLTGASSVPAVDALQRRLAGAAGRRIVDMVWEGLRPSSILTEAAFRNGAVANFALAGSTNAAIHLLALARRAGVGIDLKWLDGLARETPVLADVAPSGRFLLEDFYAAGGLPALLNSVSDRLALDCATVAGRTLGENIAGAEVIDAEVIRPPERPVAREGFAALFGNLAPDGCVTKPSAASAELLRHRGAAVVFEDRVDYHRRVDDPSLPIDPSSVLVMKEGGPQGGPGMPEWGMLPLPKRLLQEGVKDMVRISDARMSGTSYGTVILHVSPESHVGGPLAFVRTGDEIEIDVPARRIHLHVTEAELANRRSQWSPPAPKYERGYGRLFLEHVRQAHEGCDFDFLEPGAPTEEPAIFL